MYFRVSLTAKSRRQLGYLWLKSVSLYKVEKEFWHYDAHEFVKFSRNLSITTPKRAQKCCELLKEIHSFYTLCRGPNARLATNCQARDRATSATLTFFKFSYECQCCISKQQPAAAELRREGSMRCDDRTCEGRTCEGRTARAALRWPYYDNGIQF